MKRGLLIGVVLCLAPIIARAEPSNIPQVVEREAAFGGCHFEMKDPYNGTLRATYRSTPQLANYDASINPKAKHPFRTWIQFSCQDPATPKTYRDRAGIRMTDKGWALDSSPESIGPPEQHTTFHALRGRGWSGGGVTLDGINGDKDRRTRVYAFCIPHNRLALCGIVRHVGYLQHLDESVLPQVIQLLENIEFIDSPPASSSSTQAATVIHP